MNRPRILVTGAAGFIGTHTVIELLTSGFNVVGLDNFCNSNSDSIGRIQCLISKIASSKAVDFQFHPVDVRDKVDIDEIFKMYPVHGVIHFAGLKAVGESFDHPLAYWDNNVGGTISILNSMKDHDVKNFVFSSSATIYGVPKSLPIVESASTHALNPYGQTKLVCEHLLEDFFKANLDWNISLLRYFNPVGAHESGLIGELPNGIPNNLMPYLTQVAAGLRKELSIFGSDYDTPDGTCIRDFIHVVDLARGHVATLRAMLSIVHDESPDLSVSNHSISGLHRFNFGTGFGVSVKELVDTFQVVSGQKIKYRFVGRRPGDIPVLFADVKKAKEMLGWQAERTVAQMCSDAWRWQINLRKSRI